MFTPLRFITSHGIYKFINFFLSSLENDNMESSKRCVKLLSPIFMHKCLKFMNCQINEFEKFAENITSTALVEPECYTKVYTLGPQDIFFVLQKPFYVKQLLYSLEQN